MSLARPTPVGAFNGWWRYRAGGLAMVAAGGVVFALANHYAVYRPAAPAAASRSASAAQAQPAAPSPGAARVGRITIPAIGVQAVMHPLGLDASGQMVAPADISTVGWYDRSVEPGALGLSIVDGHVDGPAGQPGAFFHLAQLKPGDGITIARTDGVAVHYRVMSLQSLPVAQAPGALFSQDPKVARQLNLITCGGLYDGKTGQYADRVIVSAVQL